MNGGAKRELGQQEKNSPWVGLMALGIICTTIVVIAYIIWGGC